MRESVRGLLARVVIEPAKALAFPVGLGVLVCLMLAISFGFDLLYLRFKLFILDL